MSTQHKQARILVIDDTVINLTLMEGILGNDYQVTTASSGEQGIACLSAAPYDLILLDIMMPTMDGFETLKRLRSLPYFGATPVVFLTALDDTNSQHYGLQLGADDYIIKLFAKELVKLRIRNLLRRARLQNELELAMASAQQSMWTWHLDSQRVVFEYGYGDVLDVSDNQQNPHGVCWSSLCDESGRQGLDQALQAYLRGYSEALDVDMQLRNEQGNRVWINLFGKGVRYDDKGRLISLKGVYRNINRRKMLEEVVRHKEEQLRHVLEATNEGVWDWDIHSGIVSHNAAWCRIQGLEERFAVHEIDFYKKLVHPDDFDRVEKSLVACFGDLDHFACEYRMQHRDGHYIWVADRGKVVDRGHDGAPIRMVGAIRDITERKRAEAEIRQLAFYDALTGLANRRLLVDRLQQAINQHQRNAEYSAVMFLDMDRFKQLNDTLGHDHGDMLLIEIARRLSRSVRESDTVSRLGGDEFVVLIRGLCSHWEHARDLAERIGGKILAALNEPYQLGIHADYRSTPSIGLSLFGGRPDTPESVLKRADQAMYAAKRAGRNRLHIAPLP